MGESCHFVSVVFAQESPILFIHPNGRTSFEGETAGNRAKEGRSEPSERLPKIVFSERPVQAVRGFRSRRIEMPGRNVNPERRIDIQEAEKSRQDRSKAILIEKDSDVFARKQIEIDAELSMIHPEFEER